MQFGEHFIIGRGVDEIARAARMSRFAARPGDLRGGRATDFGIHRGARRGRRGSDAKSGAKRRMACARAGQLSDTRDLNEAIRTRAACAGAGIVAASSTSLQRVSRDLTSACAGFVHAHRGRRAKKPAASMARTIRALHAPSQHRHALRCRRRTKEGRTLEEAYHAQLTPPQRGSFCEGRNQDNQGTAVPRDVRPPISTSRDACIRAPRP